MNKIGIVEQSISIILLLKKYDIKIHVINTGNYY
jgi:hypothetical protein